jgi:PAS domain S-box-containing protein
MTRFSTFLQRYKPALSAIILQYLEFQKAIKAIEYANAVARSITLIPLLQDQEGNRTPTQEKATSHAAAAELSTSFAATSQHAYDLLVHEALPAYVTYTLVKLSTECLIAEITSSVPSSLTTNLIGGLSEVFCLSDPTLPDNPLIYCSEEFYRFTGYTSSDVLGRNCRFLQGGKTDRGAVGRIREAVRKGEGCNEVVLNYRRDGRGFVNILMIAPLEDEKGKVKYFLGAQVDVSRLVAGGWGLEGLEKLVQKRELEEMRGRRIVKSSKDEALRKLRELSEMFDLEESAIVRSHSRSSSIDRGEIGSGATSARGSDRPKQARRVFGDDGEEDRSASGSDDGGSTPTEDTEKSNTAWKLATSGSSGKLPGVYQRYCLIRPAPSLRIIFVSPALRKKSNIGQKPFLSHLAAPAATLSGMKESFTSGTPVTAKIAFMASPGTSRDGTPTARWRRRNSKGGSEHNEANERDPSSYGRPCWISATPLLGSDDEVGVWMVVFVDKSIAPGRTLSRTKGQGVKHQQLEGRALGIAKAEERNGQIQALSNDIKQDDSPIKPVRVGGTSRSGTPRKAESPSPEVDREKAREMYDNDGNEAVRREASEDPSDSAKDNYVAEENAAEVELKEDQNPSDEQVKDDADFERVPKADSADDEDSESRPVEEDVEEEHVEKDVEGEQKEDEDEGHIACDKSPPTSPREVIAAHQYSDMQIPKDKDADDDEDDGEIFVRRSSQPLTPTTKERIVLWSEENSDGEKETEADIDSTANDSFPGKLEPAEEESTPRAKYTHSLTQPDSHEPTQNHTLSDEGYEEGSNSGSRPETSSSRAPLYMDYLRHPGTREQRRKAGEGREGRAPSDPDCEVYSPYSVD